MSKPDDYYSNVNRGLLEICPDVERVIEFGCGSGWTMRAYRERNPNAYCVGVENFEGAAQEAEKSFDQVIVSDAENVDLFSQGHQESSFDLIIYGDVLEHFIDPWSALTQHVKYLRAGGTVCACIPNTSHWTVIFGLIKGKFEYQEAGLLDRTHLRFFTFESIKSLFEQAGLEISDVKSRVLNNPNQEQALLALSHLFGDGSNQLTQAQRRDWSTFQYVVRASKR